MIKNTNYKRKLVNGAYYRFHYEPGGYIVGKSDNGAICYYGIRDPDIYGEKDEELWADGCYFTASDYATEASEVEVQWLEHCVKNEKYMSFNDFLKSIKPVEVSNYSIF